MTTVRLPCCRCAELEPLYPHGYDLLCLPCSRAAIVWGKRDAAQDRARRELGRAAERAAR